MNNYIYAVDDLIMLDGLLHIPRGGIRFLCVPKIHLIVVNVVVNIKSSTDTRMQHLSLYHPSNKPLPTSLSAGFGIFSASVSSSFIALSITGGKSNPFSFAAAMAALARCSIPSFCFLSCSSTALLKSVGLATTQTSNPSFRAEST